MQKTVLGIFGASLIVLSTVQMSAAAERHGYRSDRAARIASHQFRNANGFWIAPASESSNASAYSDNHVSVGPLPSR